MTQPQDLEVHMLQQEPHSPLRTNNNNTSMTAAPSPPSPDSMLRFPSLSDNDLLGLESAPIMTTNANDDDDTAPSSSDETPLYNVEGDVPEDDDIYDNEKLRPLIYGYLNKLGRNGKWQRRFFETDGESLSYYKSQKRSTRLASLDLKKVGTITLSAEDQSGCTFLIQVVDRPYSLQAENKQTCMDWVITLNRVKEARMQVGGVKLVTPRFPSKSPPDFLNARAESGVVAPRVVLDANRPRTRAVDDEQQWRNMVETQVAANKASSTQQAYETMALPLSNLATWHKPRNTYYRFKHRVIKWARSIKQIASTCANPSENQVILDSHLHPPGHDDLGNNFKPARRTARVPVDENWEAREIS